MRDRFIETHPTEEQQQVVLSRGGTHTPHYMDEYEKKDLRNERFATD